MCDALLVDFANGTCPACFDASVIDGSALKCHVFLLLGTRSRVNNHALDRIKGVSKSVRVLDSDTVARGLYGFKQAVDELQLSAIKVLTSAEGKEPLLVCAEQLFTAVYSFEFEILAAGEKCTCPGGPSHAPSDSDSPGDAAQREVAEFVRQLPALRGDVTVNRSTLIPDCFGHGFSTRNGGVSCISTLSSLNLFCSSKRRDPRAVVEENKRRLAVHAGFYPKTMHFPKVNHANDVWVMGKPEPDSYDGMVTNRSGVVLAAPGADCMPLLFADPVQKVIAATHAGWRGTVMGAAMSTVNAMVREFGSNAADVVVAVGPSVGVCCYTMNRNQAQDFIRIHPDCVPDPESARPHVNIRLANRVLLQNGGVLPEHIHDDTVRDRPEVTPCTSCNPEKYFSHVRDGVNFGTQVGFIWIRESSSQTDDDCHEE